MGPRFPVAILAALALLAARSSPAPASEIVARDVSAQLQLLDASHALVSWAGAGVEVWGAVDARPPSRSVPQVSFAKRYLSGRALASARARTNQCRPYTGPRLPDLIAACTAPDGSFWAVQRWHRLARNHGGTSAADEVHVSHWTDAPPQISLQVDWVYRRFNEVFGAYGFHGAPVYGFRSTSGGNPLDRYGRNVYLDVLNAPAYGHGWHRYNSFLTHAPRGTFCDGLYPWRGRSSRGAAYRVTVIGPGVAPDVSASAPALPGYDPRVEAGRDAQRARLTAGSRLCRHH